MSFFIPDSGDSYNRRYIIPQRAQVGAISSAALTAFQHMALTRRGRARRLRNFGARNVLRKGMRRFSQARSRRVTQTSSGRGVTTQHDRQFVYGKKRMPRRQKKNWMRFKRKVHAVAEKGLGSRTVVMNAKYVWSNSTTDLQCVASVGLYGQTSTIALFNDINTIAGLENPSASSVAAGLYISPTTKFFFQSGVLDVTIRNTSQKIVSIDPVVWTGGNDITLEVDIYEMTVGRRQSNVSGTSFIDMLSILNAGTGLAPNIGGAGLNVSAVRRGVTPWDCTEALSQSRIKILKKTKLFIRQDQTATYQYRDPKRRVVSKSQMTEVEGCNKPGWTKFIYIVSKAVPGHPVGATNIGDVKEQLSIGTTRKYFYKIEGVNESRDRWINI